LYRSRINTGGFASVPAQAQLSKGDGDLRVMTYNVDEGTDFIEAQKATDLTQFLIAVGQTITQVRARESEAPPPIAFRPTIGSRGHADKGRKRQGRLSGGQSSGFGTL
jgi:hypothetical protein